MGASSLGALVLVPFGFMVTFTMAGFQDVLGVTITSIITSILLGGICGQTILYPAYHQRKDGLS